MKKVWDIMGRFKQKRNQCFVLMPFSEPWSNRIWQKHIKKIVTAFGMACIRADDLYGREIMQDIWRGINESRIILADITGRNPNVLYELGVAHAIGKDVVILAQNIKDVPFDLRPYRCIIYQDNSDGYEKLEIDIPRFIEDCLFRDLKDNFGERIKKDDKVLLFVSTGGTCRCVMANAITRYYLKHEAIGLKIKPLSAGLIERTFDFASSEARKVINDELGTPFEKHKTIKTDFELLKRANLILTMDSRLLDSIPVQFRDKAELFTEFFGSEGIINDPYKHGYNAYKKCFQKLKNIISKNVIKIREL